MKHTTNELMAMDALDLRATIAALKNVVRIKHPASLDDDGAIFALQVKGKDERAYLEFHQVSFPEYALDIRAAWDLAEEARLIIIPDFQYQGWAAGTSPNGEFYPGKTAPMAICRAWIAWKEKQE